ncbi:hypothetical protein AC1031_011377 [Aphanomyces cochlioides]|nr:hypothetical protein AC1031_011377 [Aphanomyces cochlioides]
MTRFQNVDFSALWNILASVLLQAELTDLIVEFRKITSADVNLVVETIRHHTTLETLYIRCDYLPFDAANTILDAAPSCLQRFPIVAGMYNQTQMKALQEIASKKSIVLV